MILNVIEELRVSAPGRICLFGEHQDYLGLPVIPAAISLRLTIEGRRRTDSLMRLELPDLGSSESFALKQQIPYLGRKDYFRSVANVLYRHGYSFPFGYDCEVRSRIPVNAGTSSSSALSVAWTAWMMQVGAGSAPFSFTDVARHAHEAEVVEFQESGGMMDQFSSALGGVLFIEFFPEVAVESMEAPLKSFVLGDSGEPKDTQGILARLRNGVQEIVHKLMQSDHSFSLHAATTESIQRAKKMLEPDQYRLLTGTVANHEITCEAHRLLRTSPLDHRRCGELLTRHQAILRDVQKVSTPKIDRMIDAALAAGAFGAKINGSGGGGCMFAYAPDNPEPVAEAINRSGGKAYVVTVDRGVTIEHKGTDS
jgi:galactokinase